MIESITLKKIASYDENGVRITGLTRLNFFFGRNGSGKSTIAKYLYTLSTGNNSYPNCSTVGYNPTDHKILVFDDEFISRNFIQKRAQKGVFSLNEKNEEIDNSISKLEKRIRKEQKYYDILKARISRITKDRNNKEALLKRWCFEKRDQFKTFTKFHLKHPGSKDNFLREVRRYTRPTKKITLFENLKNDYRILFEKDPVNVKHKIEASDYKKIRKLERELNVVLKEVVTGNSDVDIANMIERLGIKQWVEAGLEHYHNSKESKKCPFCQKLTIDDELIKKFELYFDDVYKEKIKNIQRLYEEYSDVTDAFLDYLEILKNEYDEKRVVTVLISDLKAHFASSIKTISEKINFSSERKRIDSISQWKQSMSSINKSIAEINSLSNSLTERKNQFEKDVWTYLGSECSLEISNHDLRYEKSLKVERFAEQLQNLALAKIKEWESQIARLKEKTVSTKTSVDRINKILRNSGFSGFEIIEKEDKQNNISQYFLRRNSDNSDHVFPSLSEGEKNFISFLYFYQLCLGTDDLDHGSLKKIIVIDDPVSSLDSQVLFIVSTLIHQLIGQKKGFNKEFSIPLVHQVFILTHNIYFYKEVSLNKRPICKNQAHFFVTKSVYTSVAEVANKDLLFDDYSLLWKALKEQRTHLESRTNNILIANNMRRIIESYVHFNGLGDSVWVAINDMDKESSEYILCSSFLSAIHDGSHKSSPLDDFYYQRIIGEDPGSLFSAFEKIFDEIGKDHYKLMMAE